MLSGQGRRANGGIESASSGVSLQKVAWALLQCGDGLRWGKLLSGSRTWKVTRITSPQSPLPGSLPWGEHPGPREGEAGEPCSGDAGPGSPSASPTPPIAPHVPAPFEEDSDLLQALTHWAPRRERLREKGLGLPLAHVAKATVPLARDTGEAGAAWSGWVVRVRVRRRTSPEPAPGSKGRRPAGLSRWRAPFSPPPLQCCHGDR